MIDKISRLNARISMTLAITVLSNAILLRCLDSWLSADRDREAASVCLPFPEWMPKSPISDKQHFSPTSLLHRLISIGLRNRGTFLILVAQ
jgi:hypothetical protein